jgi:hypothetical protein
VLGGTPLSTGGVVSTTVIFWLQPPLFPEESVARQVHVTTKVSPQAPAFVTAAANITWTFASQLSLAVGVANEKGVPHSTVRSLWQKRTGASVSRTMTLNEQVFVPTTFVAVQVMTLVATVKLCGDVMIVLVNRQMTTGAGEPVAPGTVKTTLLA